jgi:outer membrane usher protein
MARAEPAGLGPIPLQLEVRINGYPVNLIAAFVQLPDGRIGSPRSELEELGVAVPGAGPPDEIVVLDSLAGATYVFDEAGQSIDLKLADGARLPRRLDASRGGATVKAESGTGLAVNYIAYGAANFELPDTRTAFDGASLTLDARAFSRLGTLRQTGILGTTTFADATALRLDTTWTYSDQERMHSYRVGDVISGGLAWTRPIRLGGAQVQRNFDLRPDLVTMPLPLIEGSAEVPSTVKVFIDGVQAYASDLQPGPFRIDNLPVYTHSGTARVVVTDTTGREVDTEQDFFTSPQLLKEDLYDFSIEAGLARRDFATESFGYDDSPVGVASLRYGITDILTAEAHAEVAGDLVDLGVGALLSGGRFGLFNAAIAGSLHEGGSGLLLHAGWEARFGDFGIDIRTTRTIGDFFDLAAVTEKPLPGTDPTGGVPEALDRISLTYAFRELKSGIGASFVHQIDGAGERSLILSGSYAQSFANNLTAFVSGFVDFGESREFGAFAGLSMPLGPVSTSVGGSVSSDGWSAVAEASRPNEGTPGSYGWRVSHGEGDFRYTAADGSYRGAKAGVSGRIVHQGDEVGANLTVEGAAVAAGDGVFLGNTIHDSFAVVDAGAPGVAVEYENRFAGTTDAGGRLLLPQLRSFQKNKIAIDVGNLPLNAAVGESEAIVVPRDMAGVVVDFGVKADAQAALVILTDGAGAFLPEGSEVVLEGAPEPFLMGYDGQVYLTGLAARNTVTVKAGGNRCRASFDFAPATETQTAIGPLPCLGS